MIRTQKTNALLSVAILCLVLIASLISHAQNWQCEILPAEHLTTVDSTSGAEITYITTDKSNDTNLYFHDRCWLLDGKLMLFKSDRTGREEIFGYIPETGELILFNRKTDAAAKFPEASRSGNKIYIVRDRSIYAWEVSLDTENGTTVSISEEKLCEYPEGSVPIHGLNENADGTLLSFGYQSDEQYHIAVVNTSTGVSDHIAQMDYQIQHMQFSKSRPDLISYARSYGSDTAPLDSDEKPHARIWFVNINTKTPVPAFYQVPGELVTHECWWVNDQITFIGGHRKEEGHVKVLDLKTNEIRVIGAGAWIENVEARELSKVNWWHAAGSPDGRWVLADNWHGVLAIFDAKTTQMRILTSGHRIYGSGAHPHAGWDLSGNSVEFTSNKLGNPDVCIGVIPQEWQQD
jgi:oligogalacturonide lyase